jgi:hypothetical protein
VGIFNRRSKAADVRPMVSVGTPPAREPAVTPPKEKIVALPPVYCLTEADVSQGFEDIGAIQRAQDERMVDPEGAARRMVALADGVAGYYLRRGGNRNLRETLVESLASWSMYTYAPVWLRSGGTPDGDAAQAAYDIIREFADRYEFLEETGGRAIPGDELSPLPARLEGALLADGWSRGDSLLIRMFEAADHYVQEVLLYPEDGGFELVVGLMELPDAQPPSWVAEEDSTAYSCVLTGGRVMLKDRILDQRIPIEEIAARAAALAQRGTDLEAQHADLGARQIRLTDPGSPEESLDANVFVLLRGCVFGLGLYGPGTLDEAMTEFARLNSRILTSLAVDSGLGVAVADPELALVAMTGPRGSLVAVCQLGDSKVTDQAVPFGGKDVANGWSMMMISRGGVTFGTVGELIEGAHAVPLWELEAFAHARP